MRDNLPLTYLELDDYLSLDLPDVIELQVDKLLIYFLLNLRPQPPVLGQANDVFTYFFIIDISYGNLSSYWLSISHLCISYYICLTKLSSMLVSSACVTGLSVTSSLPPLSMILAISLSNSSSFSLIQLFRACFLASTIYCIWKTSCFDSLLLCCHLELSLALLFLRLVFFLFRRGLTSLWLSI